MLKLQRCCNFYQRKEFGGRRVSAFSFAPDGAVIDRCASRSMLNTSCAPSDTHAACIHLSNSDSGNACGYARWHHFFWSRASPIDETRKAMANSLFRLKVLQADAHRLHARMPPRGRDHNLHEKNFNRHHSDPLSRGVGMGKKGAWTRDENLMS